jgi:regulator of RNase E activity RraA
VIVIDAGGELERALWGDQMARLASERRIAGLVIDGAVRDVDGIEALAFPVFAAGCCPTPPHRNQPGELGIAITCGGMRIRPGDIIYGDTDGVVVIPAERYNEVLRRLPNPP